MHPNQNESCTELYSDLLKKVLSASIYDESLWAVAKMDKRNWRDEKNYFKLVKNHIKHGIISWLDRRSYLLVKRIPFDAKSREMGRDWPNLMGLTMVGTCRLNNVQACIEDVLKNNVPGDFIETGAWRGGVTIFMRALLKVHGVTDRTVWVADSFEGLPPSSSELNEWDLSQTEYLKVSLEKVQSNFSKFGLLDDQVKFLKGWFCDTLPTAPIEKLAILRLDGDLYRSTTDALVNLYPKVSKGGYIIVDDYLSWPTCKQAVTDYLRANNIKADIKAIDDDGVYWKCE